MGGFGGRASVVVAVVPDVVSCVVDGVVVVDGGEVVDGGVVA